MLSSTPAESHTRWSKGGADVARPRLFIFAARGRVLHWTGYTSYTPGPRWSGPGAPVQVEHWRSRPKPHKSGAGTKVAHGQKKEDT